MDNKRHGQGIDLGKTKNKSNKRSEQEPDWGQLDCESDVLGRVVRRLVSANPGLNFNPGLFFFSSKAFSLKIFCILFRVANRQIVDKKN